MGFKQSRADRSISSAVIPVTGAGHCESVAPERGSEFLDFYLRIGARDQELGVRGKLKTKNQKLKTKN